MEPGSANATARRHPSSAEILGPRHTLSSVCPVAVLRSVERVKGLLHVQRNRADRRYSPVRGAPKRRCLVSSRAFQTGCLWKPQRWLREFLPMISPKQGSCGVFPCIAGRRFKSRTTAGGSNASEPALGRFDVNRLDHFIGFVRTYEVSAQAKTAVNGRYEPGGGAAFFEAARKALGSLPFIADDLGAITPDVVALLDQLQIPGTRVLQFEFGSKLETNSDPPAPHPVKSVVYTGTHDNDTTAGWYAKLPTAQREALQKQLGANNREVVWAMIGKALASPADTAIIPAQDLLELGVGGANEFSRNCERKLAMAPQGWRADPGTRAKAAQHNHDEWAPRGGETRPVPRCQGVDLTPQIAKRAYELYERQGPPERPNRSRLAPRGTGNTDGGETMTEQI